MDKTKQKQFNRRLLWRFLDRSRGLFVLSMVTAALSALADMLSPQIIRLAVDNVIGGKEAALNPLMTALVERLGGEVVKVVFLLELAGLAGRTKLGSKDVDSAIIYEGE